MMYRIFLSPFVLLIALINIISLGNGVADDISTVQIVADTSGYSVTVCACDRIDFECVDWPEYELNDELVICLTPSLTSLNISNFEILIFNDDVNYAPVELGTTYYVANEVTSVVQNPDNDHILMVITPLLVDFFLSSDGTASLNGTAYVTIPVSSSRGMDDSGINFSTEISLKAAKTEPCLTTLETRLKKLLKS